MKPECTADRGSVAVFGSLSAPSSTLELPQAADLKRRDERLTAMKHLVADVAHSLNNSLAPVSGYLTLLAEEFRPGTNGEQYLSRFESAVGNTQKVVEMILQASHPERYFSPRQLDLTLLLQRTVYSWAKGLPKSVHVSLECEAVPCTLRLDEAQWVLILEQLLSNAEIAVSKAGAVEVRVRQTTLTAAEAEQLGLHQTGVVELAIHDTGCGMTGEVLQRAYDPLFTTRPHGPTGGLGLTIVHGVVLLHGGQLWIDSSEDSGTTVRIWLPAE